MARIQFVVQITFIAIVFYGAALVLSIPTTTHACAVTLSLGSQGSSVSCLQQLLTLTGDYTYGEITSYYGPATQASVQKFQTRKGIVSSGTPESTGYGLAGLRTRVALLLEAISILQKRLGLPSGGSGGGGGGGSGGGGGNSSG